MRDVIIVGGGASGVLTAIHLLRQADDCRVTLIEKSAELGAGAAYSTTNPEHLLNVRASNMSAFPDEPGHFAAWLSGSSGAGLGNRVDASSFAPRQLYRDYLAGMLAPHLETGRFRRIRAQAVALGATETGVWAGLADATRLAADFAVVATGNEGPDLPPEPWRHDGWRDMGTGGIAADAAVVVVGTGLTMVDRVMALLHAGHRGALTAVSRHGLSPQAHRVVRPIALAADEVPFGATMLDLAVWMRHRARQVERSGGDWRSVVDALRPHTQTLWQRLPLDQRRVFLRHARPFWDVHRHRISPDAARRLDAARASGQLTVVAAHVTGFTPLGDGVDVHLARRGTLQPMTLRADAVLECRGRSTDVTRSQNPVLTDLLGAGLARPDPLALGLDVSLANALIGADGTASRRLYAVGPVTSGTHWEVVAIPDIRQQAAHLAITLLNQG